jgi:hypothetical protein
MEAQRNLQQQQLGIERDRLAQTASEGAKNRENALELAGIKKYGKAGAGGPGTETIADTAGKAANLVGLINSGQVAGSALGQGVNAVSSALGLETGRRTATENYAGAIADTLVSMASTSPKLTKIIDSDGGMKVVTSALGGSGQTDKAKYDNYARYYNTWKADMADKGIQAPDLPPFQAAGDVMSRPSGRRATDAPPSVSGGWSNFKAH